MKLLTFLTLNLLLTLSAQAVRETRNGADVFDYSSQGEGYKFFDILEYGDSFNPKDDLPEFRLIQKQIDDIKVFAPKTAHFLEYIFNEVPILWSFVEPELKSVPATGDTKLIITYQKIQAAISDVRHYTVQINKNVWKQLSEMSRAFLILHEALWFADRAEAAYEYFNPYASFHYPKLDNSNINFDYSIDIEIDNFPRKKPESDRRVILAASDVVNLNDVTTTSTDIRRQTGYLMQTRFSNKSPKYRSAMRRFLCANTGSVNSSTRVFVRSSSNPNKDYVSWIMNSTFKVEWDNKPPFMSDKAPLCTIIRNE